MAFKGRETMKSYDILISVKLIRNVLFLRGAVQISRQSKARTLCHTNLASGNV